MQRMFKKIIIPIIIITYWGSHAVAEPANYHKIPPEIYNNLETVVSDIYPKGQITQITPLTGESVDQVFRIMVSGPDCQAQDYFVRIFNRKNTTWNKAKMTATKIMTDIWGRPDYIIGDGQNLMITEYIQGRHLALQDLKQDALFKTLMQKLKTTHNLLNAEFSKQDLPEYPMTSRALSRLKELEKRVSNIPNISKVKNILKDIMAHQKISHLQPVHNDIRPDNIILGEDGQPYLVDWAELTWGHIYDDLAGLAEFFNLNREMEHKLLKLYFNNKLTSDSLPLLKVHRWVQGLHRVTFKVRSLYDESGKKDLKDWQAIKANCPKDLKDHMITLETYLQRVNDLEFRHMLEKAGVPTHISFMERIMLWLTK